jgi:hypothetical protein
MVFIKRQNVLINTSYVSVLKLDHPNGTRKKHISNYIPTLDFPFIGMQFTNLVPKAHPEILLVSAISRVLCVEVPKFCGQNLPF